jgi:Ni2+-binding GTPase involved in maturation of urease and hydrogenase
MDNLEPTAVEDSSDRVSDSELIFVESTGDINNKVNDNLGNDE